MGRTALLYNCCHERDPKSRQTFHSAKRVRLFAGWWVFCHDGYFVAGYLFGEIAVGEMQLNELGRIVEECWLEIPEHFSNTDVDIYAIMPNHLHGIILINHEIGTGTIYRARTTTSEQFGKPTRGSLPTIVRTFKASVTRRAGRELNSGNIWHRNYYEHIIRDEHDYERIANYIAGNPISWANDSENPNQIKFPV
jgi:putative transposase